MNLHEAARILKEGGIVAFPTETVYGLGANALDAEAIKKVFAAKGRSTDNPLIVHVCSSEQLHLVVRSISPLARKLMRKYWPGPLTIIFPASDALPIETTGGLTTVAVRMPAHDLALALIQEAGVPLAAPSANKSGRPSPTTWQHVRDDFPDIPLLEGEVTKHGLESTVVSVEGRPRILRQGALSLEELKKFVPGIVVGVQHPERAESPGLKYKHYAPDRPLRLFGPRQKKRMQMYCKGKDVVVLCQNKHVEDFPDAKVVPLGSTDEEMAQNLFSALRTRLPAKELVVLGVSKKGIGRTIMDRLERASR